MNRYVRNGQKVPKDVLAHYNNLLSGTNNAQTVENGQGTDHRRKNNRQQHRYGSRYQRDPSTQAEQGLLTHPWVHKGLVKILSERGRKHKENGIRRADLGRKDGRQQ